MPIFVVTGGAGFIGSHLCDALLAEGHEVRILDDLSTGRLENVDPRCDVVIGDVASPSIVQRIVAGADGCFHLAAIASVARGNEDWLGTHRTNQAGTVAVLDAARAVGSIPVVYASSAAIYGDVGNHRAHESLLPAPRTAYGADKLGSELHARAGFLVHGIPTLGLRFFNVYGPRQDSASPYSGVISIFARRIADAMPLALHGDGEQTRDFIFVADVVEHLMKAMRRLGESAEGSGAEVFNVCTGRAVSIRTLAETLGKLQGSSPQIVYGPARIGDIRHSVGDPSRAIAALDISARTSLEVGLSKLLALQPHSMSLALSETECA